MTTKTSPTRRQKKRAQPPVPESTDRAIIAGREFLLIPSDDFAEWYADQILAVVAAERFRLERRHAITAEEFLAKYKTKARRKPSAAKV